MSYSSGPTAVVPAVHTRTSKHIGSDKLRQIFSDQSMDIEDLMRDRASLSKGYPRRGWGCGVLEDGSTSQRRKTR
jgi:hypothetical protein